MGIAIWSLFAVVAAAAVALTVWGLHRLAIALEDRGYLYYRRPGTGGGGGGVLHEIDRLTRPSVQHIVEAEDFSQHEEDHAAGE